MSKKPNGSKPPRKPNVMVAGANDIFLILAPKLKDRYEVQTADDFMAARGMFNESHPSLLICGLDENGRQYGPLFKMAARHKVPVLAVATTEEAVEAVTDARWAVDRRNVEAITSLAQKLLDDPEYIPDDKETYPPPRKSSRDESTGGVKISQTQFVKKNDDTKSGKSEQGDKSEAPKVAPILDTEQLAKQLESRVKAAIGRAWDDSTQHFISQAQYILALQERVAAVEETTQTLREELGEMIDAVSLEGATLHGELKERVDALAARNSVWVTNLSERLDAMVNENAAAHTKLQERLSLLPGGSRQPMPDTDGFIEGLRASVERRTTEIDAIQTALTDIRQTGAERETSIRHHVEMVEKRLSAIEAVTSALRQQKLTGAPIHLLEEIESRFTHIETAMVALESAGPAGRNTDITQQFEDIWGTQTTINKLQKRLNALERRVIAGPLPAGESGTEGSRSELASVNETHDVLFRRMDELDRRTSLIEESMGALARQHSGTSSPLSGDDLSDVVGRISSIEMTLSRLKEGAVAMASIPDFSTQFERTRETQQSILKRLSFLEKISSTPPPPRHHAASIPAEDAYVGKRISDVETLSFKKDEPISVNPDSASKLLREKTARPYSYHISSPESRDDRRNTDPQFEDKRLPVSTKESSGTEVTQRSIIRTSTAPPKSASSPPPKGPHKSERKTLIGQKQSNAPGNSDKE